MNIVLLLNNMQWGKFFLIGFLLSLYAGCSADKSSDNFVDDFCGDFRLEPQVYYGTNSPKYLPLSPSEVLAIGTFGGCSGTIIAEQWVLTAKHCRLSTKNRFCIGINPSSPSSCSSIAEVFDHPSKDLTLVHLEESLADKEPTMKPISLLSTSLNNTWIGAQVEAAGYGQTEKGTSGTRLFTSEPIVALSDTYITVDGKGKRGLCFGDSGGPVMVLAPDGSIAVAGALSNGDASCLGKDRYARVDLHLSWVESIVGSLDGGEQCGALNQMGRCIGDSAVYCNQGATKSELCTGESTCGFSTEEGGFRCITATDPCEGIDGFGYCEGNTAVWCNQGRLQSRDCGCEDKSCSESLHMGGAYCVTSECGEVGFTGTCNGNAAEWCFEGRKMQVDCTERGKTCGFINEDAGYYCQ